MSTSRIAVILGLLAAIAIIVVFAVSQRDSGSDLEGRLERLRSIPYTTMSADIAEPSVGGVLIHDGDRAAPGYNLYCSEKRGEAYLMDMSGDIVHTWEYREDDRENPSPRLRRWIAAEMLENGDLLVIAKKHALIKLDWHSNLEWSRPMPAHHDVTVAPDGTLYMPNSRVTPHRGVRVLFDYITHLDPEGEDMDTWWTYDHLDEIRQTFDQRSFLDTILDSLAATDAGEPPAETGEGSLASSYDYFHVNTANLLPRTTLGDEDPRFAAGNLLTCFRNVNQIAILDRETWQVLWVWGEGVLEWPHYPVMLESGNILVFDNGVVRNYSRVLELDPVTLEIVWDYTADPPGSFFSKIKGAAQRLPDGNTLICDSTNGRVFEVTPRGETVWEWINPATEEGHRVHVDRMDRLPPESVEPLLKADS